MKRRALFALYAAVPALIGGLVLVVWAVDTITSVLYERMVLSLLGGFVVGFLAQAPVGRVVLGRWLRPSDYLRAFRALVHRDLWT